MYRHWDMQFVTYKSYQRAKRVPWVHCLKRGELKLRKCVQHLHTKLQHNINFCIPICTAVSSVPTIWMQSLEVWIMVYINLCEHNIHYNSNFSPSMIYHVATMSCLVSSIFLGYLDLYLLCSISVMYVYVYIYIYIYISECSPILSCLLQISAF